MTLGFIKSSRKAIRVERYTCEALIPSSTSVPSPGAVPSTMGPTPTRVVSTPTTLPKPFAEITIPAGQPVAGADSLNDPNYPQMGNGDYDVLHYTINLTVDVANNQISDSTTLDAQATEAIFSRQNDELIITPAAALVKGEKFAVTVSYSGNPQSIKDSAAFGEPVGWFADAGVYVASEADGAMDWYPVINHPLNKATQVLQPKGCISENFIFYRKVQRIVCNITWQRSEVRICCARSVFCLAMA